MKKDIAILLPYKEKFNIKPNNIALYQQAFRHKSNSIIQKDGFNNSNERLEYLGDAIISMIVADYLYNNYGFCFTVACHDLII